MSIQLEHIHKSFGDFRALDDITVTFADGELTALLGPSGSGKTTLLRLVAGLEEPDRHPDSRLLFAGRDVSREPVGRRQVGFVFQHYALFRHLTVFENVAFGLQVKPRRERLAKAEIADRVHELLRLVQLDTMADRVPTQLSGGQRQRVALARALAIQPRVLLLDEPFGALDAKVRAELRRSLRELHDRLHLTSVLVTHDQEEALEVADRIVVMNQGRIEQIGTPDAVFHRPANAFVHGFLGEVNVFCEDHGANPWLARPHELVIRRWEDRQPAVPARVQRVLTAGPIVKILLRDQHERLVQVHLPHEGYQLLPVVPGEMVRVALRTPCLCPANEALVEEK